MIKWLGIAFGTLRAAIRCRYDLVAENLALRQQLAVMKHQHHRPRLTDADRYFWVALSRIWLGWHFSLHIVQTETVVRWHRGRPKADFESRALIRQMCRANPLWGAPRIHGELLKHRGSPSQNWRTFLQNHAKELVALDFFTVPTATFRVLFVLVILSHDRRRILHFNVTEHPSAEWTARQLLEACGTDDAPRFLVRDRDAIYGETFRRMATALETQEVLTAPRSPWQNAYAERVIGSIRRECLNHMIVLGERHLRRILRSYKDYYNQTRTHLSLDKDAPEGRPVQPPNQGKVFPLKRVGGLHHEYVRRAA